MIVSLTHQLTQIQINVRLSHVKCNVKSLNDNTSILIYRRFSLLKPIKATLYALTNYDKQPVLF